MVLKVKVLNLLEITRGEISEEALVFILKPTILS